MDIVRKIGTAIVFIIPTFVFSGLIWSWFHSWLCVIGMMIIVAIIYSLIITGKFSGIARET
ncbi:MAG: hypothetical protein JRJ86_17960 [Deltaproteobacteria bacterium]|nr:hypothetical protein [Deltaproteobacteria bacterium]MBW2119117.1 hypothetical protein [Deltaproteobacteria bacterium]MBW2345357.1 hypothetical protein [Deltaproteobacteria bacterium]